MKSRIWGKIAQLTLGLGAFFWLATWQPAYLLLAEAEKPNIFGPKLEKYKEGEVLVKFKEGVDPQRFLGVTGFKAQEISRLHNIAGVAGRFKKNYQAGKISPQVLTSALGFRVPTDINRLSDEEAFRAAYPQMPEVEKALYRTYKIILPKGASVKQAVAQLKSNPDVEYAEPNYIGQALLTPNDPYFSSSRSWGQSYDDLWGLKATKLNGPAAWDLTQGDGVLVAVIDTGVDYNHPDLRNNIWTNPGEIPNNGIDDDHNGFIDDVHGYDFVGASWQNPTRDSDPMDVFGHGTHVAGTIAGEGNNAIGVIGVAPRAKIMAVRGLDNNGSGPYSSLAEAVRYAADNGAKVLSNSWGGTGTSQALIDAFHYADSKGAIALAAAGNSNQDVSGFNPANIDTVIAVSASTHKDEKCSFSNYGDKVEVAAPGGGYDNELGGGWNDIYNILSTMPDNSVLATSHPVLKVAPGYYRLAGTSMACPHAAGVVALIRARNPSLDLAGVRNVLHTASDDIGTPGKDIYFGYGRVNALKAVQAAGGGSNRPAAPTNLTATLTPPKQVDLHWKDNSSNETNFIVLRKDLTHNQQGYSKVATLGANVESYSDTTTEFNTNYRYRVYSSINGDLFDECSSNLVEIQTPEGNFPAAPSELTASLDAQNFVKLTWKDNSSNENMFIIRRKNLTVNQQGYDTVGQVGAGVTTFTDQSVARNTNYRYRVYSSINGELLTECSSNYVEIQVPPDNGGPQAPGNLTATAQSTSVIRLSWTNNTLTPETQVLIERGLNSTDFNQVDNLTAAGTTQTKDNTGLAANTKYYYRLRAQNTNGTSGYTAVVNATTQADNPAPQAPSNLTATAQSTSVIRLSWTNNTLTPATNVLIERSLDGSNFTQLPSVVASGATQTKDDSGLAANTKYYYRLRAQNSFGTSDYTAVVNATTQQETDNTPYINLIFPKTGSAGRYVFIVGKNFGSQDASSRVSFSKDSTNQDAQIVYWNGYLILCKVPQLASGTYALKVITSAGQSNSQDFVVVSPEITLLMPASGSIGRLVFIWGNNFGVRDSNSKIVFSGPGGTADGIIVSWSNIVLACKVPQLPSGTYAVTVVTSAGQSNSKEFVLATPQITLLMPSRGSPGRLMLVWGSKFGARDSNSKIVFSGSAGRAEATILSWSNIVATCTVPQLPSGTYAVTVETSAGQSNSKDFTIR